MLSLIKAVDEHKIIVIMRKLPLEKIIPVTQALYDGGIRLIEVTFDQKDANHLTNTGDAIQLIADKFGDSMHVGAGTVLTIAQVEEARKRGASYIVSPNTNKEVIQRTIELGMGSFPGAFTPSEIVQAYEYGAHYVKLFPGGELGAEYLKAVCAPLSHIPIVVVGGVNAENMQGFIKAGASGFGIGSNIVNRKLIDAQAYLELTELALTYTKQFS